VSNSFGPRVHFEEDLFSHKQTKSKQTKATNVIDKFLTFTVKEENSRALNQSILS
jgi:hypothetical protein